MAYLRIGASDNWGASDAITDGDNGGGIADILKIGAASAATDPVTGNTTVTSGGGGFETTAKGVANIGNSLANLVSAFTGKGQQSQVAPGPVVTGGGGMSLTTIALIGGAVVLGVIMLKKKRQA